MGNTYSAFSMCCGCLFIMIRILQNKFHFWIVSFMISICWSTTMNKRVVKVTFFPKFLFVILPIQKQISLIPEHMSSLIHSYYLRIVGIEHVNPKTRKTQTFPWIETSLLLSRISGTSQYGYDIHRSHAREADLVTYSAEFSLGLSAKHSRFFSSACLPIPLLFLEQPAHVVENTCTCPSPHCSHPISISLEELKVLQ